MPRGSMLCDRGDITVKIGRRITIAEQKTMGSTALALKKEVYRRFVAEYFSNWEMMIDSWSSFLAPEVRGLGICNQTLIDNWKFFGQYSSRKEESHK